MTLPKDPAASLTSGVWGWLGTRVPGSVIHPLLGCKGPCCALVFLFGFGVVRVGLAEARSSPLIGER